MGEYWAQGCGRCFLEVDEPRSSLGSLVCCLYPWVIDPNGWGLTHDQTPLEQRGFSNIKEVYCVELSAAWLLPLWRRTEMGRMQQQGKWEIWAWWRVCLLFCLPDLHHSGELEPLGSRGALGGPAAIHTWLQGAGVWAAGCSVGSISHQVRLPCLLSSKHWQQLQTWRLCTPSRKPVPQRDDFRAVGSVPAAGEFWS